MRTPIFRKKFKKDLEKCKRRGLNTDEIRSIMNKLIKNESIEPRYKNHELVGEHIECWECHIRPDWLLIYILDDKANTINFVRTGSRSDLF